jgi:DNA-binding GntR family transcriptional regulator
MAHFRDQPMGVMGEDIFNHRIRRSQAEDLKRGKTMPMTKNPIKPEIIFDVRSLRKQVYEYLRNEMSHGRLEPGSFINLNETSQRLGISKTPLRDALIQLECEGFVSILPRRGVLVKRLTIEDVRNILEVVGALESAVILSVFDKIGPEQINRLQGMNRKMIAAVEREDFDTYYQLNIDFHDVFLDLNENADLQRIVTPLKQRLYDFPRRTYIKEWELINCNEHQKLIEYLKEGKPGKAARLWRDSHWSFKAYEKFIRRFYADSEENIASHLAWR